MNYAIILAGGTGTRVGGDVPKQYLLVNDRPIISYCLETFQGNDKIDKIVIVVSEQWEEYVEKLTRKESITKYIGLTIAGETRQHSIINGLIYIKKCGANLDDNVIIHDAARPCVSDDIINQCIELLEESDGAMPVLPVKDTVYLSINGKTISSMLNRDEVYAGQAPESFKFGKYFDANMSLSDEDLLSIRGSSEVAFRNGMNIRLFRGSDSNYKITTLNDLKRFEKEKSIYK